MTSVSVIGSIEGDLGLAPLLVGDAEAVSDLLVEVICTGEGCRVAIEFDVLVAKLEVREVGVVVEVPTMIDAEGEGDGSGVISDAGIDMDEVAEGRGEANEPDMPVNLDTMSKIVFRGRDEQT